MSTLSTLRHAACSLALLALCGLSTAVTAQTSAPSHADIPGMATTGTASIAPAAGQLEVAGVFKKVQGSVSQRAAGAAPRAVTSGAALAVGDRIHAGTDAGASFTLSDGTELMLGARSSVALREYRFDSTTNEGKILLDFIGGQLRVISGLISKQNPANLKVQAPTAVVGVRGTDFILESADVDE